MVGDQLRLVCNASGEIRDAAEACEVEVFRDRYGVTREQIASDFAPYDRDSVWLAVVRGDADVVAAMRMVQPNLRGLKSLADAAGAPWHLDTEVLTRGSRMDLSRTWDILSMSRRPGLPRAPITAALVHGYARTLVANGATHMVAVLDHRFRILLDRRFGLRYHTLPGAWTADFLGSPSVPVYARVPGLLDQARRINPEGFRLVMHGQGLEDIALPHTDHYTLQPRVVDLRDRDRSLSRGADAIPAQRSGHDNVPWPG